MMVAVHLVQDFVLNLLKPVVSTLPFNATGLSHLRM